ARSPGLPALAGSGGPWPGPWRCDWPFPSASCADARRRRRQESAAPKPRRRRNPGRRVEVWCPEQFLLNDGEGDLSIVRMANIRTILPLRPKTVLTFRKQLGHYVRI